MHKNAIFIAPCVAALLSLSACASKLEKNSTSNAAIASRYENNKYIDDIETVDASPEHEDQGAAIDPRTQAAIDDTIRTVYDTDFERCLEADMDELENRWLAGVFTVEFTIETSGVVSSARVLSMDIEERRTPNADGKYVSAGGAAPRKAPSFKQCLEQSLLQWEFDPPPEVKYTHTYNAQIGEAW